MLTWQSVSAWASISGSLRFKIRSEAGRREANLKRKRSEHKILESVMLEKCLEPTSMKPWRTKEVSYSWMTFKNHESHSVSLLRSIRLCEPHVVNRAFGTMIMFHERDPDPCSFLGSAKCHVAGSRHVLHHKIGLNLVSPNM